MNSLNAATTTIEKTTTKFFNMNGIIIYCCWDLVTTNYQKQIWILLFCVGYNQIDQVRIWIGIAFNIQFHV
jgi:hypothetical protein